MTKMKINTKSRPAQYYLNKKKGMTNKDAALKAGYPMNTATHNTNKIESSLTFQQIEKALSYKDELLARTTLGEVAQEQLKVVYQDSDLGAKNQAIKQVQNTLEPENAKGDAEERVIIVLREPDKTE